MSYLGVLCKQRGGTFDVLGGAWSPSVKSKVTSDQVTSDKEGRNPHTGLDWPTYETSGPRKEGKRASGVHTLGAKKNPAGVNLRGVVMGLGLLTVARKGTDHEKQGEQQAEG